jgi:hypothetical protein
VNRVRSFFLTIAVATLMGAGAFAQVDPPPAGEPGGVVTPGEPGVVTPGEPNETVVPPAGTPSPADTVTTVPRDDGFDWGWIGLLGLLGLAGLSGRNRTVEHDTTRVTTHPTGTRTDPTTPPRR